MKIAEYSNINPDKAYVREFKDNSRIELLYRYNKNIFHEEYYKRGSMNYRKIDQSIFLFTINYYLERYDNIWYEFNSKNEAMEYINTKRVMEELTS